MIAATYALAWRDPLTISNLVAIYVLPVALLPAVCNLQLYEMHTATYIATACILR